MNNKCKTKIQCFEEYNKCKIKEINIRWIIGCLISVIVLLLTYKFWGKNSHLEDLISIGSGFVSIALGIFAIFYAFIENIKASQKESKVDSILDSIKENVKQVNEVLNDVEKISRKTGNKVVDIEDMIRNQSKVGYELKKGYDERMNKNKEDKQEFSKEDRQEFSKEDKQEFSKEDKQEYSKEDKQEYRNENESHFVNYIRRGEIYFAELSGRKTPVLVISNDIVNKISPNITIVPITSRIFTYHLVTHVSIDKKIIGVNSVALIELVNTIPKSSIIQYLGTLPQNYLKRVEQALLLQFGVN